MGLVIVISLVVLLIVSLSVILIYSTRINVKNVKEEQKNIGKKIESRSSESNKHTNFVGNKLNMEISKMNDEIKNRQNRDKRLAHEALVELREQINDSLDVQRSNLKREIGTANSTQTYLNSQRQLDHEKKRSEITKNFSRLESDMRGLRADVGSNFERYNRLTKMSSNADSLQITNMGILTASNITNFSRVADSLNNFFDIDNLVYEVGGDNSDNSEIPLPNFEEWFDNKYSTHTLFTTILNNEMRSNTTTLTTFSNNLRALTSLQEQQNGEHILARELNNSNYTNNIIDNSNNIRENTTNIYNNSNNIQRLEDMLSSIGLTEVNNNGSITLADLNSNIRENASNMSEYERAFNDRLGTVFGLSFTSHFDDAFGDAFDTKFATATFGRNSTFTAGLDTAIHTAISASLFGSDATNNTLHEMYETLDENIRSNNTKIETIQLEQGKLQNSNFSLTENLTYDYSTTDQTLIAINEQFETLSNQVNSSLNTLQVNTGQVNTDRICFGDNQTCIQMSSEKLSICKGEECKTIWDYGLAGPLV
jgi:hypothetical protein